MPFVLDQATNQPVWIPAGQSVPVPVPQQPSFQGSQQVAAQAAAQAQAQSTRLQAPAITTTRQGRYTAGPNGTISQVGNGQRAPLPPTTGSLLPQQAPSPTSFGGYINAAYGRYTGAGNQVGPTNYNGFQQYIPGYDGGVASLSALDDQQFARTIAAGQSAQFWAELQQQQLQFEQQLRETILNNRRTQLLENIGVSGRSSAPTSRLDIR